jgi:hypothetical protein
VDLTPFLADAQEFTLPVAHDPRPLVVIDASQAADISLILPPFPVIALGDPGSAIARQADAVIEAPVTLERVVEQICASPNAASVAVQALRLIETLPVEQALAAESMAFGLLQGGGEHAAWLAKRAPAPAAAEGMLHIERLANALHLRMDRPDADNAIDRGLRDALRAAFEIAALDSEIEQVTLRSSGRTFSLGADLAEFGTTSDPVMAHAIRMSTLPAHAIARCASRLEVHVQGACVCSGLEMIAFARRITASPRSWFHLPELAMGLMPGAGGSFSISRRIGRRRTALLILSGQRISAQTALAWGLVDALVDD